MSIQFSDAVEHWGLTPRELDLLESVCRGYSPREIAQATGLSTTTVPTYLKRINGKARCHTRAELTALALGLR